MIIFRPHRSSLAASMQEAKEFENVDAMIAYIAAEWNKNYPSPLFTEDDITICGNPMSDLRISWWDQQYVCVNRMGDRDFIELHGTPLCIGWCATQYDNAMKPYH